MKNICILLFFLISIGMSAQRTEPEGLRVFGNSISWGLNLKDLKYRFGNVFADTFGLIEYNGSIGGMTLVDNDFYEEQAMDFFEDSLLNINSDSNDIVIVMFGTNDMTMIDKWDQPFNQTYADQYRSHLSIILDSLLNKGFDLNRIIIASDPFSNAFLEQQGRDTIDKITYEVSYQYGAICVDMSDQINDYGIPDFNWRDGYTVDYIHPDSIGHQIMYEIFRDAYLMRNQLPSFSPTYLYNLNNSSYVVNLGNSLYNLNLTE